MYITQLNTFTFSQFDTSIHRHLRYEPAYNVFAASISH